MSADASYNILQSHADGHVVLPQPVGDLSLIDSVTGFIQEAYVNVLPAETKMGDRILWAKFVPCEPGPDVDSAPLILVLAYSTGVQAWNINSNGEAKEVLSWHQGIVKAFQFLPSPSLPLSQSSSRDMYLLKRPLVALCDNGGPSPPFHNVTFLSLSTGEQVKHIKFKNEVCEILANKRCIIVTFSEKIAIFDACSLDDKFTITTCYPSPGIKCNPVSLGSRWLAFGERRLLSLSRSRGGYEGEGAVSYTASVLQAAKSLGKGLRELSGTVANSLTGAGHGGMAGEAPGDGLCPGVVTVLDIECKAGEGKKEGSIVAHFVAHTTPIVALSFDPTGLLLLTAEKRGHKFNVFRIEPSKSGSAHATVQHLYILHRGDTTARVQDITFSSDSRWVAVSSMRGTTHVFPITMYGGSIGLRTHTTPHVVNRLSRFHKSAGIASVTPSPPHPKSPPLSGSPDLSTSPSSSSLSSLLSPSSPLVLGPLAQIRRQLSNSTAQNSGGLGHRQSSMDESTISVKVAACFAPPKCSSVQTHPSNHTVSKTARKSPAPSIFLITGHGYLIQYDLEPRPIAGLTKDKLCDDTPIDLLVEPRCQWRLFYPPTAEKMSRVNSDLTQSLLPRQSTSSKEHHDKWLSQVEIITHAGPHRRLWMGPQFSFKTYTPPTSGEFSFDDIVTSNVNTMPTRSTPMNIEKSKTVPVLIETVSTGSSDQSPRFMEELEGWAGSIRGGSTNFMGESQLCEDLADAMQETHNSQASGQQGVSGSNRVVWVTEKAKVVQKPDQTHQTCPDDRGEKPTEPTYLDLPDPSEKIVEVLCESSGMRRVPLEIFVRKHTSNVEKSIVHVDMGKAGEEKKLKKMEEEKFEKVEVKEDSIINIVDDLFSIEDVSGTKRNRKSKKAKENREDKESKVNGVEEEVKERKNSREEKESKRTREETARRQSREEMNRFEEFIDLNQTAKTVEPCEDSITNNIGAIESKKKSRRSKKNKDLEPELVEMEPEIVDKIEDVDESLFAENIDIDEDKEDKKNETTLKERKRSEKNGVEKKRNQSEEEATLSDDLNRYDSIENENQHNDIEPENRYEDIETEDRYEEVIDHDMYDEPYQYEDDYDPYDEELVENMSHAYIQDEEELLERPVEPSLFSDFPDIQSFERPRTPVTGLGDGGIIDSGCGLKKRKNKKKKR